MKVGQWLDHTLNSWLGVGSSSSGAHYVQARTHATADMRDVAVRSGGSPTFVTSTELCIETPQVQIWTVDATGAINFYRDGALEFSGSCPFAGLACNHFSIGGAVNGGAVSANGYQRLVNQYVIAGALTPAEVANFGWWEARQFP